MTKYPHDTDTAADTITDGCPLNGLVGRKYEHVEIGVKIHIKESLGDGELQMQELNNGGPFRIVNPAHPSVKWMPDAGWVERELSEGRLIEIREVDIDPFDLGLDEEEAQRKDPYCVARFKVVRAIAERGVNGNDPKLSKVITEVWAEEGLADEFGERPETKRVRAWLGAHDPETVTAAQLMSKSGRVKRASRLDPDELRLVVEAKDWFYDGQGRRLVDACGKLTRLASDENKVRATRGQPKLRVPSRETLRRCIGESLDREHYARKYGEKAAVKNWDGGGRGVTASRIGELGLIDDTILDAVACFDAIRGVPAGRPYLCLLIDVASRCIVGYLLSFEPPTAHTALETVKAANRLKTVPKEFADKYSILQRINCRFEKILADNGSNYVAKAFGQALLDAGTTLQLARVGHPRDKAIVERVFHSLKTFLLEKLPGATFKPQLMREYGYDPEEAKHFLTVEELRELIELWICVYHITLHSGIGMQPALKWQTSLASHGRHMITNVRRFGVVYGETVHNLRLTREGLLTEGVRYIHETNVDIALDVMAGAQAVGQMQKFDGSALDDSEEVDGEIVGNSTVRPSRRAKIKTAALGNNAATAVVKIKRNTANMGRIHVFVPGHGWLELVADNLEYFEGLSLHQHRQIRDWAKARNLAFSTPEEQLLARDALVAHIETFAPELPTRERRALARIVERPAASTQDRDLEHAFADPRHDGMAGVIEAEIIDDREDSMIEPSRPEKGGKKGRAKGKPKAGDDKPAADENLAAIVALVQNWTPPVDEDERLEEFA